MTAGAMGTSIATTLWDQRAAQHHARLTEPLVPGQPAFEAALESLRQAGLSTEQALAQIVRQIDQQAFTRAADDIFLVSSWLFLGLIGLVWLTRRPPPLRAATAEAGSH
jgi:DHA2 family multidrug resistance protein